MTEHYVTLFDQSFLPQGLALHHSLQQHGGDFSLWILCLDHQCLQTLQGLNLHNVNLLDLRELETPELLNIKPGRNRAEYCWTLTPWAIQWVFEADTNIDRVTYVDADVFVLKSPSAIFQEFDDSGMSVMITEHGYGPDFDQTQTSGKYCVQFLPVNRGRGERILHWWRDRCIEWCFDQPLNGNFGDQGYLLQFKHLFPGEIHDIRIDSRFQGPWNASIHPASDAVIYHFHSLRIGFSTIRMVSWSPFGMYRIPPPTMQSIYEPYCRLLIHICDNVLKQRPIQHKENFRRSLPKRIERRIRKLIREWIKDREDDFTFFAPLPKA